ncbi:MAG TPA: proline dehydrogenase family protein [Mycobacteriales bacterium]|jgi:proline dehydrogenase|nr:proline dehydrogenase family protein [Mycobacteriales bacterium]
MLRTVILAAGGNQRVKHMVSTLPVSRDIVRRYVAGESLDDAVRVGHELAGSGLLISLDRLGEDCTDAAQAEQTTQAYVELLSRLGEEGLTAGAEVSLKLSAVGQALDESIATDHAATICAAAAEAGTMVTFDMEDHSTTDSTLGILTVLRKDFPSIGAVLQAYLRRTEGDCRELAYEGSRVRLCKGAYKEPESVAFRHADDVDRSYVRCLNVLMGGAGRPLVATHDPRLVAIASERARWYGREAGSYEFQMLYGIRADEQRRLVERGETVRVYVPYGNEWYGYLMRRLAERPANVGFFLRSLVSQS